ncbi:PIN-like domain-containing protein [Paracoccus zhejiangensis]|uniref:PIN-like domain-containing protein n=1 Tax=Paracoccus zhejiangensis TaxID=1077935 RepID=UPI0012FFDDB2
MIRVLFDHNMPPALARCLHEAIKIEGHEACALRDKFPKNISDIELYTKIGKESNWITLSKDVHNAKRKPEKAAILKSGVLAFYLAPTIQRKPITQQAALILWHWERMVQQRLNNRNGLYLLPENKGSKFKLL